MAADGDSARLHDIGEESLVRRLTGKLNSFSGVIVGPGDDCAVIDAGGELWQLLKSDCIVEGIHFSPGTEPTKVGKKAMNRALSDIAAMGGLPLHALVTIASGRNRRVVEVEEWYEGMIAAAEAFDCAIVGGETAGLPGEGAMISISLTGSVEPEQCVRRSGAKVGDCIVVTGKLGGSLASGRHLDFVPRIREARWLVSNARPTAMMDLSDGLGSDLPRLAEASGVGFRIEPEALPLHPGVDAEGGIRDGEDYELLFAMSPDEWAAVSQAWVREFPGTHLTRIGEITKELETSLGRGWEHYKAT